MENKLKSHIFSVGTLFDELYCPEIGSQRYEFDRHKGNKKFLLTQARKQNEVILKMIEEKMNYEWATSDWKAALDAIAELIREANRE